MTSPRANSVFKQIMKNYVTIAERLEYFELVRIDG